MKVVLALLISALSAIESILLAWLFVSFFVAPGGSGEFTGINQFVYAMVALVYVPAPVFVAVFVLVSMLYKPENRKALISFASGLLVAITTSFFLAVFANVGQSGPPWHLIINVIILTVWTTAIIFRRHISIETAG